MSECKIKICGLNRPEDIDYVNAAKPDYAGFVIDFPKSHRNCSIQSVKELTKRLDPSIRAVGVFVNERPETVAGLLADGTIYAAQLHGQESNEEILWLQKTTQCPVIKAFKVQSKEDIALAIKSPADYILLDQGYGGGQRFDWNLVPEIGRSWFLAGGLGLANLETAIRTLQPYGVDLSSSVEINHTKDKDLIYRTVDLVRKIKPYTNSSP